MISPERDSLMLRAIIAVRIIERAKFRLFVDCKPQRLGPDRRFYDVFCRFAPDWRPAACENDRQDHHKLSAFLGAKMVFFLREDGCDCRWIFWNNLFESAEHRMQRGVDAAKRLEPWTLRNPL